MEYRPLGASDLKVPALSFGCATFGGSGPLFGPMGASEAGDARRMVDICLDAGVTLFDTADVYSAGASEEVLGAAIKGRRDRVLISTKLGLPMGRGDPGGYRRERLLNGVDAALKRLGVEYVDLLTLHAFDAHTPPEELLESLDQLVRAGKVRHFGASNYPAWRLMHALDLAKQQNKPHFVTHQVYYSLVGRDYEWELMPLGLEQGVGAMVWSPLGWGRLTGKVRRGQKLPETSRLHDIADNGPPVDDERLYRVVDTLDAVEAETGKTIPQIALAWLLSRPSVSSVLIGARNEKQLLDNLGAVGWSLTTEQVKRLDDASATTPCYPNFSYRIEKAFRRLNSPVV